MRPSGERQCGPTGRLFLQKPALSTNRDRPNRFGRLGIGFVVALLLLAGCLNFYSQLAMAQESPAAAGTSQQPGTAATDEAAAPAGVGKSPSAGKNWEKRIDRAFEEYLVAPLKTVLFFDFHSGPYTDSDGVTHPGWLGASLPFVVVWLAAGAIFLTLRMAFINIRSFRHAVCVTRGDYDNPNDAGEVSHFQALSSALAATVGMGNIAGVAIAVSVGGPGAVFWMVMLGLFGMTSKFTECTLGQLYRHVSAEGRVTGGPMVYLKDAFRNSWFRVPGAGLSILFAILCIGGSFGGGCAFQVSQSLNLVRSQMPTVERTINGTVQQVSLLQGNEWIYGVVMMVLVGVVILGGIRRIAATAEKIVPLMCGIYLLGGLVVLGYHWSDIPSAVNTIFNEAFNLRSVYGGLAGVIVWGVRRAAFSNEAGCGSASIAHAAAKTPYPVREGIVACLEPFIDTVVICYDDRAGDRRDGRLQRTPIS